MFARGGRRYIVCGLRVPPRRSVSRVVVTTIASWVPVSTLVLAIIVSAYASLNPIARPQGPARIAGYSIDDYATAVKLK